MPRLKQILIFSLCFVGWQTGLIRTSAATEITTNDLNQSELAAGQIPDPTRVKFEMVSYNPYEAPKLRGSVVGKVFRAFGALTTPAFFFPGVGTAVGAAGLSLGSLGNHMDSKASQPVAAPRPMQIYTPGLNQGGVGGLSVGRAGNSMGMSDPALDIIAAKR